MNLKVNRSSLFFCLLLAHALSLAETASIDKSMCPDFGKTHFIVGFDHTQEINQSTPSVRTPSSVKVFFSPDDNVQEKLISFIDQELVSIKIAVFVFTDEQIAQALIRAKNRGVDVQIIIDPSHIKDRYSKIKLLEKNKVPIFEYNPEYLKDKRSNLMHHKFVIFGTPDSEHGSVWTGSFNFTQAATKRNQENAVLIKDYDTVKQFFNHYETLKKRCAYC